MAASPPLSPQPGQGTSSLLAMIQAHYENDIQMSLVGEIYFDSELSQAEVEMVSRSYSQITGRPLPHCVYLPCCGTLRHVQPLFDQKVQEVVAVDLSQKSIERGLAAYALQHHPGLSVHCLDIRSYAQFAPPEGFELSLMLGNSFGDILDQTEHLACLQAIASSLSPSGVLLFDYVSNRYVQGLSSEPITSRWPEQLMLPDGQLLNVIDERTRRYEITNDRIGILRFDCRVLTNDGIVLDSHNYAKLVIDDHVLADQFRSVGMLLEPVGPVLKLSDYHRARVAERSDLGMLGEPNFLYCARRV